MSHPHYLDDLAHFVGSNRLDDLHCIFLASQKRLCEVQCLFHCCLARHWRFVRVDNGLHNGRPLVRQGFAEDAFRFLRALDSKASCPAGGCDIAKSIGSSSTPNSGLPSRIICSHLIWPSTLFLMTITHTCSLYFTRVAISPISMSGRVAYDADHLPSGVCYGRADAYGKPLAIVASEPDTRIAWFPGYPHVEQSMWQSCRCLKK